LELDAFLENQGVEFVVIVLPSRRDLKRNHYHDLTNLQALLDFARVRGIRTIDVKPYLMDKLTNGNDVIEDIFWSKDQHFKPLGYRYMAEAIQQGLCDPSLKLADQLCPTP